MFRKALYRSPILGRSTLLESTDQALMAGGKHRTLKYWIESANPTEHIWLPANISSGLSGVECHIGERDCRKTGEKRQCTACHVLAHSGCMPLLIKMNLSCKPTFRENIHKPKDQEEMNVTKHHWVHKWRQDGKCARCTKSFQQKFQPFNRGDKEVLAIACSWCKLAYHNKHGCFVIADLEEQCSMGMLGDIIVPPKWMIKLPVNKPNVFRRRFSTASHSGKRRSRKKRLFMVKPPDPLPFMPASPLLIFVNPKSGGNKGARLMNTFCWLLNPRQVFDIMAMKGPKYGLEMYRKLLPRLKILVCGGDGTVGWLLSTLDSLRWAAYPPVGILPLGTGNDLARTLGWGGSFTDEPMESLLMAVGEGSAVTYLDRWHLQVDPNLAAEWEETVAESAEEVNRQLPLSVMNNYFSIGADANVALQFHQSRSANPAILNSRFKNRLFYGGIGTVDLFKRSWKDLSEFITIECDGVDLTPRIQELKLHCILFINIPRYAGGTLPWGNPRDTSSSSVSSATVVPPSPSPSNYSPPADLYPTTPTPKTSVSANQSQSPPHTSANQSCRTPSPNPASSSGPFTSFHSPSINDGQVEVLGFTTTTLATLQVGGRGERLAQCSRVKIVTTKPIPVQVDGEPCRLAPSIINIGFHSKVPMLRRVTKASSSMSMGSRAGSVSSTSVMSQHKISTVSATDVPVLSLPEERLPVTPPVRKGCTAYLLRIPLTVISWKDYDLYKDDLEQLKAAAYEVGSISVNSEDELEKVRPFAQQILENGRKPKKNYVPSNTWHFIDYVSTSEDAFRVPRVQENLHSVADICNTEEFLLLMDEAFVNESPKKKGILKFPQKDPQSDELSDLPSKSKFTRRKSSRKKRKRFSEPLKLILSGESGETLL